MAGTCERDHTVLPATHTLSSLSMSQSALPQCITALWLLLISAPPTVTVHCRLRHCQPVRQRTPSSTTRRNQYDAAEALYPAHDDAMTSLAAAVLFMCRTWQITCAMTSSLKPEVRNVSQRRQRKTEPQSCTKMVKIGQIVPLSSRTVTDRQTDRQTRSSQY